MTNLRTGLVFLATAAQSLAGFIEVSSESPFDISTFTSPVATFSSATPSLGAPWQTATGAGSNPNAPETSNQLHLDTLATSLFEASSFDFEKATAKAQYLSSLILHGIFPDSQLNRDIDSAIDELVFSSIQKAVNSDPAHPKVYSLDRAPSYSGGTYIPGGRYSYDNPDCIYRTVPISSEYEYVLHGKREKIGPTDVTFSLIGNVNSQQTIQALYANQLVVEQDGTFNISISSQESDSPNHIRSTDSATQLFIRNNIGDWNTESPDQLTIEIVNDVKNISPLSNDTIVQRAKKNLAESSFFYGFGALSVKTLIHPTNQLESPEQSATLGTLTSQAQSFGHYSLDKDEALVVTIDSGNSSYWVIPVSTFGLITSTPWESIVSLNSKQAVANDNGTFTAVVSEHDPGVYNWINTTSRSSGTIMGRWQGLSSSGNDKSSISVYSNVVKIADLKSFLPPETKFITAQGRKSQLQDRIKGYNRIHGTG